MGLGSQDMPTMTAAIRREFLGGSLCGRESSGRRRLDLVKLAQMKQEPKTARNHPISENGRET